MITFQRSPSSETITTTQSVSTSKRKRDELDDDDQLHRGKRVVREQQDILLSYIDDLTLSLNLHQLDSVPSTVSPGSRLAQKIEARQSPHFFFACA